MLAFLRRMFCADARLKAENEKLRSELWQAFDLLALHKSTIETLKKNAQRKRDEYGRFAR